MGMKHRCTICDNLYQKLPFVAQEYDDACPVCCNVIRETIREYDSYDTEETERPV